MAKMMFPTDVTFVPMLVHLCIDKSSPDSPPKAADYSKPPSSTGIVNVGLGSTLDSIKESLISMLELDKFFVDNLRRDGLWCDVTGSVEWQFAVSWEVQGLPDSMLVCDQDLKGALELLEVREWKGHLVAMCYIGDA